MEQYKGYAALLVSTGSHPISKRAAPGAEPTHVCAAVPDQAGTNKCALVYVQSVLVDNKTPNKTPTCEVTCDTIANETTITIDKLTIIIQPDQAGFNLSAVNYTQDSTEVTWFPNGTTYSCGTLMFKPNDVNAESYEILGFQIQLSDFNLTSFNALTWSCSAWITTPIVMGFIVVIFYLFILFGAILLLMDIKTNDRFDDPKGKTITVNVSE